MSEPDNGTLPPLDPDEDEDGLAGAAASLIGIPPVKLLRLFSVTLAMLASRLVETAEETRGATPLSGSASLHAKIRAVDDAIAQGIELSHAQIERLKAERRRLNALLIQRLRP